MLRANLEEDETTELGKARPGKALKITLSNMVFILRVIGKSSVLHKVLSEKVLLMRFNWRMF